MKRTDRIKLDFTRNWNFPGKERLSHLFKPSDQLKQTINNGIVWLNNEDIAIYTTADNYIEWTILSTGTYEDEINKLIRISLRPGDIAIDIGGNIGLQSIRMGQCVGNDGKVLAFEPLNYLREKFEKNIRLNRLNNISLYPFALSDMESEAEFNIDTKAWNQGTFSLKNAHGSDRQQVTVKVADDLTEIGSLPKIDLIKIDVEGFEFNVLRGLKGTLTKHKPRIIFEFDINYWTSPGQDINECYQFLSDLNYKVYQITSVGCELIINAGAIVSGNLFCIQA
ncbi:FkbM family methyltransferase [Mucilaginibacter sp.]|jgi:FkbM family methyltransferase|uniref:FkbM family methyltransferase n=1 Tax=Mucilaginibacter sp. TaxID=1882438 RepID=UPI003562846E